MKTEMEIREKLKIISGDERLGYEPADVFVNAPLALSQVDLKAKRDALMWVLGE